MPNMLRKGYVYQRGKDKYLDNILDLRNEKLTYDEIASLLGTDKASVYGYCYRRGMIIGRRSKLRMEVELKPTLRQRIRSWLRI